MIAKEILVQLPEMARCLHFAINNHRVQGINYVHDFVRDFPSHDLRQWDTTMPVLSACAFLKIWFKDHLPNSVFYKGGFTDADLLTVTSRDFIRDQIQVKVKNLIAASHTIGDYDPFQTVICDTILALNWAMSLIDAMESGHFVNWNTLEIQVRDQVCA